MSASVGDLVTDTRNAARPNSARVTSGRSAGGSTLACDNLSGWPTASKVHFVTYTVDTSSNPVAGTQLDCYGIVSGNNITSFTVVDGSDSGNQVGDYVEMLPTAAWGQDLATALTAQHNRNGTHKGVTTDTLTVSTGTTLPAGDIGTADLATGAVTYDKVASGFPVQIVQTDYSATTSGSTVLPIDSSIPQNTEGFEVMSQSITPKITGDSLLIEANVLCGGNTGPRTFAIALFQDSTANAIAADAVWQQQSAGDTLLNIRAKVTAASTSSTTFKIRIGSDNAGTTVTFGNGRFLGIPHSSIKVTEVKS